MSRAIVFVTVSIPNKFHILKKHCVGILDVLFRINMGNSPEPVKNNETKL